MNGIIYMRTSPNGGKYVGQTIKDEKYRWGQHVRLAYNGTKKERELPLSRAIRKYGPDSFTVEILESNIKTPEKLDEREMYWIKEKHSLATEGLGGLNVSIGGQGFKLFTGENFQTLYDAGYSLWEIGETTGVSPRTVSSHLNADKFENYSRAKKRYTKTNKIRSISCYDIKTCNKVYTFSSIYDAAAFFREDENPKDINSLFAGRQKSAYGYFWKYDDEPMSVIESQYEHFNSNARSSHDISVVNLDTNEVFESIRSAAKKYNVYQNQIKKCCEGKIATSGGFCWAYHNSSPEIQKGVRGHPRRVVNIETNETYKSALQAAKQTGIKRELIVSCCIGMRENAGGFHWKYYGEEAKPYKGTHAKPIVCIDTETVYPSVSEAVRQTGIYIGSLTACLKGRRETAGGYHWEYKYQDVGNFVNYQRKPVICKETGIIYDNMEDAAVAAGVGIYALRSHLKTDGIIKGLHWAYQGDAG